MLKSFLKGKGIVIEDQMMWYSITYENFVLLLSLQMSWCSENLTSWRSYPGFLCTFSSYKYPQECDIYSDCLWFWIAFTPRRHISLWIHGNKLCIHCTSSYFIMNTWKCCFDWFWFLRAFTYTSSYFIITRNILAKINNVQHRYVQQLTLNN